MSPARATPSWKECAIGGLVIFGLLMLAYAPALHGDFLWDDPSHVTRVDLRSWDGLRRIWTDLRATQQYYPVLHSAFWVEHRIWGDNRLAYHLLNLVWQALAAVLLALGLRRVCVSVFPLQGNGVVTSAGARDAWIPPRGIEWVAALLFALHPMEAETVAWISEQKNTLSLVFYLGSALVYWRFIERRRVLDYAIALVLFALALGAKSVTATLPAALLVLLWWRQGKLAWRRDVLPLVPWFALAIISGLLTAWVERTVIGADGADFSLSFVQRVLLAARVIWFYTGKLLWPAHLAFFYDHWQIRADDVGLWYGLLATLVVTGAFGAVRKRSRGVLAGWLLFVGSLFPALGFFNVFPFRFSYVADHFQYLPSFYFITWVVLGGACLCQKFGFNSHRVLGAAGAALGAVLLTVTHTESAHYRSDETLSRATIRETPTSWMAHAILANNLVKQTGREAEAVAEYRTTIQLNPRYPDAHLGLANLLLRSPATYGEAMREYERALELRPNYAEAHTNLGLQLMKIPQRRAEAVVHLEKALAIRPDLPEAQMNFADALAADPRRFSEALEHYHEALRLRHPYALAHAHLARALLQTGDRARVREAMTELREALLEDPKLAEAHYYLAGALSRSPEGVSEAISEYHTALTLQPDAGWIHLDLGNLLARLPGREDEAIAETEAALKLNPSLAFAHFNLALLLADKPGREAEAVEHAQAAVHLEPGNAEALDGLGLVLAKQNRLEEARAAWENALRLNPKDENARANLERLGSASE
jgi:tetratricopeptide (TPR) repeat protein